MTDKIQSSSSAPMWHENNNNTNALSVWGAQLDEQFQKDLLRSDLSSRKKRRALRDYAASKRHLQMAAEVRGSSSDGEDFPPELAALIEAIRAEWRKGRKITLTDLTFARSISYKEKTFFGIDRDDEDKIVRKFPQLKLPNLRGFIDERPRVRGIPDVESVEAERFCNSHSRREVDAVIRDLENLVGITAGMYEGTITRIIRERLGISELPNPMELLTWFLCKRQQMAKRKRVSATNCHPEQHRAKNVVPDRDE